MIAAFLADLESDLTRTVDDLEDCDIDYELNQPIDALRDIARRISVEAERLKLAAVKGGAQ